MQIQASKQRVGAKYIGSPSTLRVVGSGLRCLWLGCQSLGLSDKGQGIGLRVFESVEVVVGSNFFVGITREGSRPAINLKPKTLNPKP